MTGPGRANHVEQHLGDRVAALVDGELEHETRERVLAHLATCCQCKIEADEQRRLKSVFARTAPPPPPEGLLARLQGLPGADGPSPDSFGGGGGGVFGARTDGFAYVPAKDLGDTGHGGRKESGFRIHDVERSGARSRRFAFAAAGAVSLAALALGGTLPLGAAIESQAARGDGAGATASPTTKVSGAVPVAGGNAVLAASDSGTLPFLFTPANAAVSPASAQSAFVRPPFAMPVPSAPTVVSPLATDSVTTTFGEATAGPGPSQAPAHLAVPLAGTAAASAAPDPAPH